MVEDRVTDGKRIAELLASELDGREDGGLDRVRVGDANPGVEPSAGGARAYEVRASGEPVATVYVHPDRARLAVSRGCGAALDAARDAGLCARSAPGPRTVVHVESGADVKHAVRVVAAALE